MENMDNVIPFVPKGIKEKTQQKALMKNPMSIFEEIETLELDGTDHLFWEQFFDNYLQLFNKQLKILPNDVEGIETFRHFELGILSFEKMYDEVLDWGDMVRGKQYLLPLNICDIYFLGEYLGQYKEVHLPFESTSNKYIKKLLQQIGVSNIKFFIEVMEGLKTEAKLYSNLIEQIKKEGI